MDNLFQKLMLGGSTAALLAVTSMTGAYAQGGDADIEQVVVSASRISIQGYTAPTPVTVIGAAQLEQDAFADIGDAVRQMPAVGAGVAPDNGGNAGLASQGTAGLSTLNLRQLGATRTLILFDNQRVVSSDVQGNTVDTGTLPQAIISRVDVVTGGASAAWGSDAVAGVINFIINKNFTGFKFNTEFSQDKNNDHRVSKTDMTWGDDFMDGRLHIEAAGSYLMAPDAAFVQNKDWYRLVSLFPTNPATAVTTNACIASNPCYHTPGITGSATYAPGGLITSGQFKNTVFVGNNGTPTPWNPGVIWNGNCHSCGYNKSSATEDGLIGVPYHSLTLFAFANYRLTPDIGASIQLNYGMLGEQNINSDLQKVNPIAIDNPFIPAIMQTQIAAFNATATAANKIVSLPVGTNNLEGCDLDRPTIDGLEACQVADGENILRRQMGRAVLTLTGSLGGDWSWTAYAQTGQMRESEQEPGDALNTRYNFAVDAVAVTTANRGTSGLAIGTITCRALTFDPTLDPKTAVANRAAAAGCVPLNTFGTAPLGKEVLNYIDPGRIDKTTQDSGHWIVNQQVFSASVQGTLPWGLAAGNIAAAAGAEYHLQQERAIADTLQLGPIAGWQNGNFTQFAGSYGVEEGFAEVDVPLLKNNFVQDLALSAAGRITDYSTSGVVETWKLGLTSQVTDDFKLRTTWSTDIRAPDLFELFSPPSFAHNTGIDPKTNKSVSLYTGNAGNPALTPEVATTISGGVIFTPQFIPGFSASLDYYSIVIKGAIFTAATNDIQKQCALGVAIYCTRLFYANGNTPDPQAPLATPDYPNALVLVIRSPLNASSQTTDGFDFQADYTMSIFTGNLNWHMVGNYTDTFTQSALGLTYEGAGSLGGDAPYSGFPKLKFNLAATYTSGPWSGTMQGRFIGPAHLNLYWQNGVNVDDNDIEPVAYMDLRGSYKWNDHVQLYSTINNVTNAPPPLIPSSTAAGGQNTQIYDGEGRKYTLGIRFSY